MKHSDHDQLRRTDTISVDEQEWPRRPDISPGKRTLTMSLPPRPRLESEPGTDVLQRKRDPQTESTCARRPASIESWMDVAMRPDLYGPSTRFDDAAQSASNLHELAAEGTSGGATQLPHSDVIQRSFGRHDVGTIEAFVGGPATKASEAIGASAYATGNRVAFREQPDLHTAAHEAAHIIQQRAGVSLSGGIGEEDDEYEHHADLVADHVVNGKSAEFLLDEQRGGGQPASGDKAVHSLQLHPAEKVLRYSAAWISGRTAQMLSKHIGKHVRRIAKKPKHSVFKYPRKAKGMLERAVNEAINVASKHASKPTKELLEEGPIKILRQSTPAPGKFRWVVQKAFQQDIGTKGERFLRILIDQSGRIVTAYPTDELLAVGLGVGALELLDASTAEAAEKDSSRSAREGAKKSDFSWSEFAPIIGDLWGGSLNEGEDDDLRRDREQAAEVLATIAAIEEVEKRSLSATERCDIEEAFHSAVSDQSGEGEESAAIE
jgi:hypothetical protein